MLPGGVQIQLCPKCRNNRRRQWGIVQSKPWSAQVHRISIFWTTQVYPEENTPIWTFSHHHSYWSLLSRAIWRQASLQQSDFERLKLDFSAAVHDVSAAAYFLSHVEKERLEHTGISLSSAHPMNQKERPRRESGPKPSLWYSVITSVLQAAELESWDSSGVPHYGHLSTPCPLLTLPLNIEIISFCCCYKAIYLQRQIQRTAFWKWKYL